MAYVASHATQDLNLLALIKAPIAALRDFSVRRAEFVRVKHELNEMSDRDLADIGITRFKIDDVAHQAADRI